MSLKQQIVCVAFPTWEGDYMKSTVQLMSELALEHEVLYVDYAFTYKDLAMGLLGRGSAPVARLLGRAPRLRTLTLANGAAVQHLTLSPFLPTNWIASPTLHDALLQLNAAAAARAIRRATAALGFERPIVVNAFNPALGNALAGRLGESKLVYYCYDEISAAGWIKRHGTRHEAAFLARTDLTIVSSAQLLRDKSPLARRCTLVKNGVSLALFQAAQQRPADMPPPGTPIVGYLGSIDERLDYDLLCELASARADCLFVFVGREVLPEAVARLRALPNVVLLGPRPPEQLADYVAAFDVSLIPFVKNKLTAGIYPLKINEYLAMGKPVVATRFGDMSDFEQVVRVVDDAAAFAAAVAAALEEKEDATAGAARRRFAEGNSWAGRAVDFMAALVE